MILRRADSNTEAGVMPSEPLLAAMGNFMEEMSKAGILLGGEGLQPSAKGALVKFTAGKPTVLDGPFTETKELIAGYCMIQVASRQEALEWAKRWPALDADGAVTLEIRQVFEAEDFGEEFTPELRAAEEATRAEVTKRVGAAE
jgi:hypothetical protein